MTHSNANEGRKCHYCYKPIVVGAQSCSSLDNTNRWCIAYPHPAPAAASQGDTPPESTPEQYASDYTSLYEIPSDVLASRIVGQLILQKGNLNKYKAMLQGFIENYRRDSLRLGVPSAKSGHEHGEP